MKRILVALYDALSITFAACLVVLVATPQAHAYVDPSVMTYTIQAVAGVAVALSAVLGVALRRTRRALFRVLKIDENANKIVEPPVSPVDPDTAEGAAQLSSSRQEAAQAKSLLLQGAQVRPLSWSQRFLRALIGCAFFVGTLFVATPLEIVAGGSDSLIFGLFDILPIVLVAGSASTICLAGLLSLIRGKTFDAVLTLVVALGLSCYLQALLFNGPLPVADGSSLDLSHYKIITLVSTFAWIVVIGAFLILNSKKKSVGRPLILVVSLLLIVMQTTSVVSISAEAAENDSSKSNDYLMTTQGLYEVGSESNVIVFVLDTFDTQIMEQLLAIDPSIADELTGFTYFRNSTGSMIPTRYGVPYLLTGILPKSGQTYQEFVDSRYRDSTFINDIDQQNYNIGVYTDSLQLNYSPYTGDFCDYADNIVDGSNREMDFAPLLKVLAKMAMYRDAPWIIKPFFWFYTDEVNKKALAESSSPYFMDDIAYADKLFDEGLTVSSTGAKAFRFIHLIGAHYPYVMGADGHAVSEGETDMVTQAEGSLRVVEEYLRNLKELGLYDEATIVITADHGYWYLTDSPLDTPTTPVLLVKPRQTPAEASQPMKVSDVPTGHLDFNATIIDAVEGDASKYGPTVFEIEEGERPRTYWMTTSNGHTDVSWLEYVINGDVLDFDSWQLTGQEIPIPEE